jgi:ribosome-associated toxin RatA of RatAB toxin-antitoxin module
MSNSACTLRDLSTAGTGWLAVLSILFLLPCAQHAIAQNASHIEARAERIRREGMSYFDIHASGFVTAAPQQAWQVLTDYERLPQFVPELVLSKVVKRDGNVVLLEQESRAGFLFFSYRLRMTVRVTEQPYSAIDIALVSGGMRQYDAHWELEKAQENGRDGTRIRYSARMEPEFFIPPLIGEPFVQASVQRTVEAVVREIEKAGRREAESSPGR